MATSPINNPVIHQVGTMTGATGYTASEFAVRRYNKVVCVKGYVSKTSGNLGTSQVTIAKLSDVALPAQTTRFICATGTYAYSATSCAYGVIDTSGNISILTSNGSTSVAVFNFWYPVG